MRVITVSVSSRSGGGIVGRIIATLFFGIFLTVGVGIALAMLRDNRKVDEASLWNVTPCRIIESSYVLPTSNSDGYKPRIRYQYTVDGSEFTSERYSIKGEQSEREFETIQRTLMEYPAGAENVCYVDPANPREAILSPARKGSLWVLLFPMIFVVVGVVGIAALWIRPKKKASPTILSSGKKTGAGKWVVVGFFSIFLLVGLGFSSFFVAMIVRALEARTWSAVPATVVFSRVAVHDGDDGDTYSVDVLYRYEYNGKTYLSNRYDAMGGSSSGRESKARIVKQMPPGAAVTAYVNPRDPVKSLLSRGLSWVMLFGLIPLVFVLVGAGGIIGTLRGKQPNSSGMSGSTPKGQPQLKADMSRRGKFIVLAVVALFWNGISWTMLILTLNDGSIKANLCPVIFLSVFAVIGLGLLGAAGKSFLQLFNPTVQFTLSKTPLRVGDNAILKWELAGRFDRITRLTIVLEGREVARYRRGTDTHTDTKVFYRQLLVDAAKQVEIARGQKPLSIPANTMHSFDSDDNHIKWVLIAKGEIPNWPDVNDEMDLPIHPLELTANGLKGQA